MSQVLTVGDLIETLIDYRGKTPPKSESGVPLITAKVIKGGTILDEPREYIADEIYDSWMRRGIPMSGDILVTTEAPLGEIAQVGPDARIALAQRVILLRADAARVDRQFLFHYLRSPQARASLLRRASGTTVSGIRQPELRAVEIPLLPRPQQEVVGQVLDALDGLINNNRRRVQVLEEMAWAIYREWFVHFRYPGHAAATFPDLADGQVPDGWEIKCIAELSAVVNRGIAPKYAADGAWIVLNQKCIRDERVSLGPARRQERQVPEAKRVRRGDVLINSTGVGTLGRVALYRGESDHVTVDSHVTIARPANALLNPWYGLTLVSKQSEFERLATGSTGQTELSRGDVGSITIILPHASILTRFAQVVWPLLNEADSLLALNEILTQLRDLLLPKLVTGQIDVSSLDLDALVGDSVT
jgi:type I restriction enzyme S subunit